ncbi:zinc finger protein Xfin isoform X2 [Drosophila busckii]|uniref:zinc finger protein Xfin isoform X2 n=1 Tax=Drosophila busckii TaxID=30019 RepID=UPI00143330D6|nr:zinc finger protein Xfin isoform X2 [Drosophila busckii]
MADTISTAASSMDLGGNNGLIVDMTPTAAALLHHNALALRSLKEAAAAVSASEAEQTDARSLAATPTPTNLSTGAHSPPLSFRCERCDNFETNSRASLLLHVVQCLAAGQAAAAVAAAAVRLKSEEHEEPENMSVSHMETAKSGGGGNYGCWCGRRLMDGWEVYLKSSASSFTCKSNGRTAAYMVLWARRVGATNASRKVFECDVCNMKFSNGANMRRHKMRHTGVKPYECRVCQKRFFRKDHLAEHFTTHTKTLPYHCPICNRGFQRQIAMRAHFQNEHVGQHDLVKTCPLCSYRAGSMKSLRIHFFNRHGIDLDNPGPGGTSSLLLALESQASAAAAAAAASYVPQALANLPQQQQQQPQVPPPASHQSDSGESVRSLENATPPMHFLTPHVEISTLNEQGNTELYNGNNNNNSTNINNNNGELDTGNSCEKLKEHTLILQAPQDLPMDCNTKATPIASSTTKSHHQHHHHHHHENHITPSISLIPIKQEPLLEDAEKKDSLLNGHADANSDSELSTNNNNNNNRITSLIKVSPLKSLLREDLKRRICAKANNRITRNATPLEHELQNMPQNMTNGSGGNGAASNSSGSATPNGSHNGSSGTPICNGTITSTGQESELLLNRKQILTCHFCGIEFPDETLYFLHKGCHCESNPWKCNICGEQLNNVYEFNSHLLSKSHQ